jgi:hypothetical protein
LRDNILVKQIVDTMGEPLDDERLVAAARGGSRAAAIRKYAEMHGCSLAEAKLGLDRLLKDDP